MGKEENNLFKFATKELSQDAFICWCINWFNYKDTVKGDKNKEKLVEMSKKILSKILENTDISILDIQEVRIIRQFESIDITLIIETKYLEQYIVIIEDKVGASLNNVQQKDLYVSKLINALENNEEKQERLFLNEFKMENIVPVFWKTGEWKEGNENRQNSQSSQNSLKEELQKKLTNNTKKYTKKEVVCVNGNDTLELLKDYIKYSEIVEDFYIYLRDYLRINNQLPEDEYCVNKIVENEKIIEGTTFSKNYYVFNCFSKLIGREYTRKSHPQGIGGIVLWNLSKRILEENILNSSNKLEKGTNNEQVVAVDTIRFFKFRTCYKNRLSEDNKIWYEEPKQKIMNRGEFYTNIRYIYLFAKKLNVFRNSQYEFMGLYKLIEYDEKNSIRIWEKQELKDNIAVLDEDEIIKLIKKIENEN